jgi:hypothetical protein
MQSHKQALKQAAIEYASMGLGVIPLRPFSKKALVKWEAYQDCNPTIEQVEDWWKHEPLYNIGIVTGKASGIVVIDIDGQVGRESLKKFGHIGLTPTVKSGGNGYHFYFKYIPIRSSTNLTLSIDVRGDGGMIVAPPSIHASTRLYRWSEHRGLTVPMIAPPSWIHELKPMPMLSPAPTDDRPRASAYLDAVITSESRIIRSATTYQNKALYDACFRFAAKYGDSNVARTEFLNAALALELPLEETLKTVRNGFGNGLNAYRNPQQQR